MLRRHQILLGLLTAAAFLVQVPAAFAAAPPAEMEWTAIDRFGGDPRGLGELEDGDPLTPAEIDSFAVRVVPSAATCADLKSARWRVDRRPAKPDLQPGEQCSAVVRLQGEGSHRVAVRVGRRTELAQVEIDDKLIVAVGDSVASGEGNPEGRAKWLDRPCHRSAAAGFEVAARRLAESDPHRSITFVSLACSGAEVDEGLLEGYGGIDPPNRGFKYLPQVDRLQRIAAQRPGGTGEGPAVDVVLLSVGANDLKFSGVVRECAISPGDCSKSGEEQLQQRLGALDKRYDRLGEGLETAAPGAPVFITEYFDPTHGSDGDFCRRSIAFTSPAESQWAYERLLKPLNGKIEVAAERNGWHPVGNIAGDFERHGICAQDRWVRRFGESVFSQGDWLGVLHPNEEGHKRIARRVAIALAVPLGFDHHLRPPSRKRKKTTGRRRTGSRPESRRSCPRP